MSTPPACWRPGSRSRASLAGRRRLRATGLRMSGLDLREAVLALLDHHLLDLGGTYGDPEAERADPVRRAPHRARAGGQVSNRSSKYGSRCRHIATPRPRRNRPRGGLGGLLLLVLLVVVVKVAGLPHRRSPFRYITSVSRFLMRNMNGQLSLMGARSDKSALQAARVRGLAAGNRCHRPGSPVFRHRSIIHSHLSARSMRPSSLMPSRIESGAIRRGVSARRVSYAAGGFSRLRAPSVRVPRRSSLSRRA